MERTSTFNEALAKGRYSWVAASQFSNAQGVVSSRDSLANRIVRLRNNLYSLRRQYNALQGSLRKITLEIAPLQTNQGIVPGDLCFESLSELFEKEMHYRANLNQQLEAAQTEYKQLNDDSRHKALCNRREALCNRVHDLIMEQYHNSHDSVPAQVGRFAKRCSGLVSDSAQQEGLTYCQGFVDNWKESNPCIYDPTEILQGMKRQLSLEVTDPDTGNLPRRYVVVNGVIESEIKCIHGDSKSGQPDESHDLTKIAKLLSSIKSSLASHSTEAKRLGDHYDWYKKQHLPPGNILRQQKHSTEPFLNNEKALSQPLMQGPCHDREPLGKERGVQEDMPPNRATFCFRIVAFMAFCMVCIRSCFRVFQAHEMVREKEQDPVSRLASVESHRLEKRQWRCPRLPALRCPRFFSCLFRRDESSVSPSNNNGGGSPRPFEGD